MAGETPNQYKIDLALAEDLVGDMDPSAFRVLGLSSLYRCAVGLYESTSPVGCRSATSWVRSDLRRYSDLVDACVCAGCVEEVFDVCGVAREDRVTLLGEQRDGGVGNITGTCV